MSILRRTLKGAFEYVLAASPLPGRARRKRARQCVVLAFHNILAREQPPTGDRPLHLPVDDFERFLDALTVTHAVVPLDALESSPSDDRPRAAITFDDAYAGALALGIPALVSRQLPVSIFVAPGLLGRQACWWDRLAIPESGLDGHDRHEALHRLRGDDEAVMRWAVTTGRAPRSSTAAWRIATEEELAAVASQPGVTFGAHSWTHATLTSLKALELRREMEQPLAWLRERFPCARPWLAYPYGITSPAVERAAEAAGYTLGFRVSGGWITGLREHRWSLPRWSVPSGLTERGFVLHTAGVLAD